MNDLKTFLMGLLSLGCVDRRHIFLSVCEGKPFDDEQNPQRLDGSKIDRRDGEQR
jgi:hypothetical protein